jgi:hypothetical protein
MFLLKSGKYTPKCLYGFAEDRMIVVIAAGDTSSNVIAPRIGIRWFLHHERLPFPATQRGPPRLKRRGPRTAPLHYGALFSTTYWKHLFGLPVVAKYPLAWETMARALPLEPASV